MSAQIIEFPTARAVCRAVTGRDPESATELYLSERIAEEMRALQQRRNEKGG